MLPRVLPRTVVGQVADAVVVQPFSTVIRQQIFPRGIAVGVGGGYTAGGGGCRSILRPGGDVATIVVGRFLSSRERVTSPGR